jgi:4-hydroxy-tetrahydrodipicolinate synthase
LLPLMKIGGAGSVTATSNLVGRDLALVYRGATDPAQAEAVTKAQARIEAFRNLSNAYVQLPAIKGMIRYLTGDAGWSRMRPPLVDLTDAERSDLRARLLEIGATVQGE